MIQFFQEEVAFDIPKPVKTKKWLTNTCVSNDYKITELNYIFCSDDYLLEINKEYLDHDYYTDIITFDNSEEEGIVEGDIYISIDRVRENAESFDSDFETELRRVLVHGLLHLLGFDDTTPDLKQVMRAKEDEYLLLF
ncbi:rRNA maturation RNase YbeY [Dyadobacter jejuensis]|uniref:Endoribonuclease YbeY n=1 Tax=Dyadobacter jejuensis TaxID=1082580 RepID=A0A316ACC7_9BACT|nr:rRNA maturation RNase YbeY [Dyadobacter jejuensis]PWJ55242.1 rRNA maturation RNase YbeY [Dyadobacter jejuensis]